MKLGFAEIMVVLIVAMLVIGPDRLPYYTRNAGKALQSFRKALNATSEEVRQTLDETDLMEPVRELKDIQREVTGTLNQTFDPFAPAAKPAETATTPAETPLATTEGE